MPKRKISNRSKGKCPPGVLCLSNEWLIAFTVIGLIVAAFFIFSARSYNTTEIQQPSQQQNQNNKDQQNQQTNVYVSRGGDDRYSRAPVPLRIMTQYPGSEFSTTSLPFNIPTQGYPPNFSSVGIITTNDGQVLPLYGRPSTYGSDRYNYYTRTDTYNPVPLPVKFGKRDCMDDNGCQEVYDKDTINIPATGKDGVATIYKFDAPKYVP